MSDNPRGRCRGDRGDRGHRARGDRGGGRGRGRGDMEIPYRPPARGESRGDHRGGRGGRGGRGFGDRDGGFRGGGRGDRGGGFRGDRGGRGGGRGRGRRGPSIYNEGRPIPAPDATVHKTEDAMIKALSKSDQKTAQYPNRPGYGTTGKPVQLYANYLSLNSVGKLLFRYNVALAAEGGREPAGKKARQIVRLLLEEHFAEYLQSIATDYRSTLISCVKLPVTEEGRKYDVRYKDENEEEYPESPKVFRVTCQMTGTLNPSDLLNYLTSTNAAAMLKSKPEIIQALNVIMGHHPKTERSIVSVGATKHFGLLPSSGGEKVNLGGGLEVLRGFFISVRAATARVLLNVQVKYLACYEEGPLATVIAHWRSPGGKFNTYRLEAFLKRMRVRITHIERKTSGGKPRPRIKAITGLANKRDGASSRVTQHGAGPQDVHFFLSDPGSQPSGAAPKGKKGKAPKAGPPQAGRWVSVAEFFKQSYNIQTDPNMPVVNIGTRDKPVYLPVEVCQVEPGQPVGTKLSPSQTANMLSFAVRYRTPAQNAGSIVTTGVSMLGLGEPPNPTLAAFGIAVNQNLLTVQGRVLSAPQVLYGEEKKSIGVFNGGWNMAGIKFSKPAALRSWAWLYIDQGFGRPAWNNENAFLNSLNNFADNLRALGITVKSPVPGKRIRVTSNYAEEIENAVQELQEQHRPELIMGILSSADTGIYNCIKQVCDVRLGIRNVNVQADKLAEGKPQYCANVGLKFNLKLGGANQALNPNDLSLFGDGKTMLVGVDVTHPSPGSSSHAPSVASMVSSVDRFLAQWPAELKIQAARQEMVSDLDELLKNRLRHWQGLHRSFPEKIVVYRDGVSESQYDTIIEKELPLLKQACKALYPAKETAKGLPRMAIVVVGKRHNTRFYPTSSNDADKSGTNPPPGTVVDRGISESRHWDFYLQAHAALQGTARPAHYFTVWDEIFNAQQPANPGGSNVADVLQGLTHKLCYLFGRATKAVSVCPPAYYADLVCTRARCYMADLFDPTPAATPAVSVSGRAEGGISAFDAEQVQIHPNVRNTMFYI